jgi:hypothetical protein
MTRKKIIYATLTDFNRLFSGTMTQHQPFDQPDPNFKPQNQIPLFSRLTYDEEVRTQLYRKPHTSTRSVRLPGSAKKTSKAYL